MNEELEDDLEEMEQKAKDLEELAARRMLNKSIMNLSEAAGQFYEAAEKIDNFIDNFSKSVNEVEVKNMPEPVKEIDVKNFPEFPTSIRVNNMPKPVEEVSIKNFPKQLDAITVKNPVESVTVKEIKGLEWMQKGFLGVIKLLTELPIELKKTVQTVRLANMESRTLKALRVVMVDPSNGKETMVSSGGVAVGGGGVAETESYKNIDVDESEDAVKSTPGKVYWIHAINMTASPLYLKLYDATVGNTTVGTTIPKHTFVVPANADSDGAGFVLSTRNPIKFRNAITIAATTGVADNNTGAPAGNALIVNMGYR